MNHIGKKARDIEHDREGIIVGHSIEHDERNWKVALSIDSESKIVRIDDDKVEIFDTLELDNYYKRLLRDIQSECVLTRRIAAFSICDFHESLDESLIYNMVHDNISTIIEQLHLEKDADTGLKLAESIEEFICMESVQKDEELKLIREIASINERWAYPIVNDIDYKVIAEVQHYLQRFK
ncbi:hypothetical protein [Marinifilum caeruleilacunae]|uniref:Uncharacterized protein n=1 Tax=Marinifilum caeruleilacunae TaxID=2499076 RepID=A0ABX1WU57_9BACT|nr:hypothetical protein [Marinifilum caeruleilacunae]NOU59636.1 hypothetical protein [Marinifilum caeruleilacunae]